MLQVLAPGVEDGQEADLGAEVLGVGGDLPQGLGGGLEQEAVDRRRVLQGDRAEAAGRVKTTWKYSTGSNSASRASIQSAAAVAWHLGQWRLRHEL